MRLTQCGCGKRVIGCLVPSARKRHLPGMVRQVIRTLGEDRVRLAVAIEQQEHDCSLKRLGHTIRRRVERCVEQVGQDSAGREPLTSVEGHPRECTHRYPLLMTSADDDVAALVDELTRATRSAAELGAGNVAGARAIEARPGVRVYMCAFSDGRIGCVDGEGRAVTDVGRFRETLRAALLVEHAEETVDVAAFQVLEQAASKLRAHTDDPAIVRSADDLAAAATGIVEWRLDPIRTVARVGDLDQAVVLHGATHRAFLGFIAATDPLVAVQDTLPGPLRDALRDVEQASGAAGVSGALAPRLAGALAGIDVALDELMGRLWDPTPHSGER